MLCQVNRLGISNTTLIFQEIEETVLMVQMFFTRPSTQVTHLVLGIFLVHYGMEIDFMGVSQPALEGITYQGACAQVIQVLSVTIHDMVFLMKLDHSIR